ncbi:hypothetical protein COLO4_37669 [Corchorus olitorius]|uniref:Uncharacterized protein n=1 Tax=Corchorus olitorius TaxID=93759 RepID=A0A1R3G027_9ROSI|nr:hypothetical protein COLO4_37669 [Corchorus olitorius]
MDKNFRPHMRTGALKRLEYDDQKKPSATVVMAD